jgi:hypothetical protein
MKLSAVKINAARAEAGDWVGDIPEMPGVRLKVRGFGNHDDRRIQQAEIEKIPRHQRQRGKISDAEQERVMNARIKGAILVDWDGITGDDDQPVALTPDLLDEVLTNPDYARLRGAIIWAGGIVAEDDATASEADAKN